MSALQCRWFAWLLVLCFIPGAFHPVAARAADGETCSPRPYDVRAYGASGDGKTVDTIAIQKAVDAAARDGGGTVCLAQGVFLSGTIVLKSHVTLHVAAGAVLRGSRDISDYPDHTPKIIYLYRPRFTKSLIYAERVENIALTGRGTIDGQGEHFPARPGDDKGRPYIVRFSECKNVQVRDLTFRDSARWLSHYLGCENVVIDGITIHSRIRENRDGIDVDSSTDVRISNCSIFSGDDAIVLKATAAGRPCRRVTITNCVLSSMASALKLGTESNGGFEDIVIANCTIYDSGYSGIGLMSVDGGTLDRVSISNVTMSNVRVPLFIRLGNRARPIPGADPPGMGALRNVTISNVQAGGADMIGCSITGIPGFPVENVTLDNIRVRFAGGGTQDDATRSVPEKEGSYPSGKMFGTLPAYGLYCRHVKNLKLHNLDFQLDDEDQRPAVVCDDVAGLDLFGLSTAPSRATGPLIGLRGVRGALVHGCRPHGPLETFLRVEGSRSSGIALLGNDLRDVKSPFQSAEEVPGGAVDAGGSP